MVRMVRRVQKVVDFSDASPSSRVYMDDFDCSTFPSPLIHTTSSPGTSCPSWTKADMRSGHNSLATQPDRPAGNSETYHRGLLKAGIKTRSKHERTVTPSRLPRNRIAQLEMAGLATAVF
mmetsp:Transcript_20412/g.46350  ORF Transcript_20412/g.46350 Transcript_20412/m.46350 type:complete len:120 (-) Transcript_20412:224-583(-)